MVEEVLNLNDSIQGRKRPFSVTLLAGLVLSITIVHLVRFINALTWWSFLTTLPGKPPLYLALTGLFGTLANTNAATFAVFYFNERHISFLFIPEIIP